jgi:hypothetical protein
MSLHLSALDLKCETCSHLQPWCDALCVEGVQAGQVCQVITYAVACLTDDTGVTVSTHNATGSRAAAKQFRLERC